MDNEGAGSIAGRGEGNLETIACRKCNAVLGHTDGLHLYVTIGSYRFTFDRSLTCKCDGCERLVYWNVRRKTKEQLLSALANRNRKKIA